MNFPVDAESDVAEDSYGCPSSNESDGDDDRPLGSNSTLQAAHARLIQQEKKAQNQRALSILEGRRPHARAPDKGDAGGSGALRRAPTLSREQTTRQMYADASRHKRSSSEGFSLRRSGTVPSAPKQLHRAATSKHPRPRGMPMGEHAPLYEVPRGMPLHPAHDAELPSGPLHDTTMAMQRMALRPPAASKHSATTPHRVFVLSVQRYAMVNVSEDMPVRQLLQATISHMHLAASPDRHRNWAVHDVLPELGIERPVREYERIKDVLASRGADPGYFLVKLTEWPALLRHDTAPGFSAALAGWVSIQTEPKKWSKRWLELREHALFTSTSESGKHSAHLCSMADVDMYLVDPAKSALSKPYGFALRRLAATSPNQDKTVAFVTQPDEAAHRDWVKAIVGAHTYILRQEAPYLFETPELIAPLMYASAAPTDPLAPRRPPQEAPAQARRVRSHRQLTRTPSSATFAAPLIPSEALSMHFQKGSLLAARERTRGPPPV